MPSSTLRSSRFARGPVHAILLLWYSRPAASGAVGTMNDAAVNHNRSSPPECRYVQQKPNFQAKLASSTSGNNPQVLVIGKPSKTTYVACCTQHLQSTRRTRRFYHTRAEVYGMSIHMYRRYVGNRLSIRSTLIPALMKKRKWSASARLVRTPNHMSFVGEGIISVICMLERLCQ